MNTQSQQNCLTEEAIVHMGILVMKKLKSQMFSDFPQAHMPENNRTWDLHWDLLIPIQTRIADRLVGEKVGCGEGHSVPMW